MTYCLDDLCGKHVTRTFTSQDGKTVGGGVFVLEVKDGPNGPIGLHIEWTKGVITLAQIAKA